MDRFNKILHSNQYNECLKRIAKYEKNRLFCNHTIEHFLSVARIAYILVLEEQLNISKEVVYTTALLHDIGRHKQYEDKIPHEIASWDIASKILEENEFKKEEIDLIKEGILYHRKENEKAFGMIMYKADKASRECYRCDMYNECNWKEETKNFNIKY